MNSAEAFAHALHTDPIKAKIAEAEKMRGHTMLTIGGVRWKPARP